MYTNEQELQRIAYHEAGHVVMVFNAGRTFKFVTINPTPGYNGKVFGLNDYHNETEAVQNALIAAAGMTCEKMKFDRVREPVYSETSDLGVMTKMINHTYGPHNSTFGYNEIIKTANYVLSVRWSTVEKIATALLQRGGLTYEECKQIIYN